MVSFYKKGKHQKGEVMKKTLIALIATTFVASSASAFMSGDDNQSGAGTGSADGAVDASGRGAGKGSGDAEGNFSMSINASGKGSSSAEADMDAAENARVQGNTDLRTESSSGYPVPPAQ